MLPRTLAACALTVVLTVPGLSSLLAAPRLPQATPAAQNDLVPVDVHVIDKTGRPITDLKASDFVVLEEGAPQDVKQFLPYSLSPDPSQAGGGLSVRKGTAAVAPTRRVFLIALGLGRLEEPSRSITGLLQFVRTKLLPQDLVAVFAYNRALPFTTDHEKVVQALERFKKGHEQVNFELDQQFGPTTMAPLYGTRVLPKKLQAKIDELVLGPGAKPGVATAGETIDIGAFGSMSLDDFMVSASLTGQDQGNLMALVEYLRRFDGDKHLLFVTEKGLLWPSDENDRSLAAVASDARVSIHSVQAGGLLATERGKEDINTTQQQAMSFRSLRNISTLTGGLPAITEKGPAALDRLDDATRSGYVLGFSSTSRGWDGNDRKIVVRVTRPDAVVLYRHGYTRVQAGGNFNRRAFVTNDRLAAAGNFRREVNDIKVKAAVSVKNGALAVDGKIDLSKVKLTDLDGGVHFGVLTYAVFCLDTGANAMGVHSDTITIKLGDEEYKKALKDNFTYAIQFPLVPGTNNVRMIVYDFGSDLIGRVDTRVF
jgi:VWFA-related protein